MPAEMQDTKLKEKKSSVKADKIGENNKQETVDNKDSKNSVYRHFELTINKREIDEEVEFNLQKYSSGMKLPGFRKGRVPVDVIKNKYGEGIRDESIEKLIEKKTMERIKNEKLQVISNPVVEDLNRDKSDEIFVKVRVELLPEFDLPEIDTLEIKVKKDELKPEKFDEKSQIEAILENNKKKVPVADRGIKDNDQVIIITQAQFADTKRLMPKSETVISVKDDENTDVTDLVPELRGKNVGDNFKMERSYKKDFARKAWAGKKIIHHIEIKKIFEMQKPDFNDEFIKSMGYKDAQQFNEDLKKSFEHQNEHKKEDKIVDLIRTSLIDKTDFEVPDSLIINEVNRTAGQYAQMLMALPEDKKKESFDQLKKSAEKSIKFSLILDEVVKKFNLKIENEELEKEYKKIAESNKIDIKEVRKYYLNKENKETMKNNLLSRKAIDLLKEKINIKEV